VNQNDKEDIQMNAYNSSRPPSLQTRTSDQRAGASQSNGLRVEDAIVIPDDEDIDENDKQNEDQGFENDERLFMVR
jgi:hypothetical protein